MNVKVALILEVGKPLIVDTIQQEGSCEGEVLVETTATCLCHTDKYTLCGQDPESFFPSVLGYKCTGICVCDWC